MGRLPILYEVVTTVDAVPVFFSSKKTNKNGRQFISVSVTLKLVVLFIVKCFPLMFTCLVIVAGIFFVCLVKFLYVYYLFTVTITHTPCFSTKCFPPPPRPPHDMEMCCFDLWCCATLFIKSLQTAASYWHTTDAATRRCASHCCLYA